MGPSIDTNLAVKMPVVVPAEPIAGIVIQALTAINPSLGFTLSAFTGMTASNPVSNPLFRVANDGPAYKVDQSTWPQDEEGLIKLGLWYREQGDLFWAKEAFWEACKFSRAEDQLPQFYVGATYVEQGRGYEAEEFLSAYLYVHPNDSEALEYRARANALILEDTAPESLESDSLQEKILRDTAMSIAVDEQGQTDQLDAIRDNMTVADSPEDAFEVLEGLQLLAQRYTMMGSVPFDDEKDASFVRDSMNFYAGRTYEVMESYCYASPYEDVHARAPLYAAYSSLAKGDLEGAEKQFKELSEKFPEADAIVTQMKTDRLQARNANALAVWEDFIGEGKQYELNQATGFLGVSLAAIEFTVTLGDEHITDRVYEKWGLEQRLVTEVRDTLAKNPDATVMDALKTISESGANDLKTRAAKIIEESENGMDNCGSYVLGHFLKLASQEEPDADLVQTVLHDFDQTNVRLGALKMAFEGYAAVKGMVEDSAVQTDLDERMKKLQGEKGVLDIVWDEVRTMGTDDLASFAIMGVAGRVGSATKLATFSRLVKGGMEARKALMISYAAGFGAESTTFWALNTVHEGWNHNLEDVYTPEHLAKTYAASLISLGGAHGLSALGKGTGLAVAKGVGMIGEDGALTLGGRTVVWGMSHTGGMLGMVGANQFSQTVGFAETPEGGRGESAVRDVFGYLKFALAPRLMKTLGFKEVPEIQLPAKSEPSVDFLAGPKVGFELPKIEPATKPRPTEGAPDLSLARQAPAKKIVVEPTTTGDADVTVVRDVPKGVDVNETAQRKFVTEVVVGNNLKAEVKDGAASTDKMAELSDTIGENAREFKKLSDAYDVAHAKFETAADVYKKNPTTENLDAANDVWAKEVDPALDALKNSPHYRLQEAHVARVGAVQLEVRPLQMELAGMETRAKASGKSLKYEVTFKRPDELNLDPNDPVGSMKKMSGKDLVTVTVTADTEAEINQAQNLLRAKGLLNGPARVIFGCLSEPTSVEPSAKPSAKPSSLLPEGAAFAGIGPAAGFMADFFGASPTVAGVLGVLGMALPLFGMMFSRSRMFTPTAPMRLPFRGDVPLGLRNEGTLGWVKELDNYVVRRNGNENVLVNGIPIDPKTNWVTVKSGDVVEVGGKNYKLESGLPNPPSDLQPPPREARTPYRLDADFRTMNGPATAGVFKANTAADVEGRFVTVSTDDGRTVSAMMEGQGRSPGQSNAAVEVEASLPNAVDGGSSLEKAFATARTHIEEPFRKDDGSLRSGAPKLNATGFELKPDAANPNKINARFVRNGGVEAIVVRLGGGNKPVFQASEGVSEVQLQSGNDVIVEGRFSESLSPEAVTYIVKNTQPATAEAIRDNLQQEVLIRAKIREAKPQGGRISSADYRAAYLSVTGQNAVPAGFYGLYEGGSIDANGNVFDAQNRPTGDRFAPNAGGFLVQIAGK